MNDKTIGKLLLIMGIGGWVIGVLVFSMCQILSMDVWELNDELFGYGFFGISVFISGTILFVKSFDFRET